MGLEVKSAVFVLVTTMAIVEYILGEPQAKRLY